LKHLNTLKNPAGLLVKKRQVMFSLFGDYRAKMKQEEAKKNNKPRKKSLF
jgi:hypothetical protein